MWFQLGCFVALVAGCGYQGETPASLDDSVRLWQCLIWGATHTAKLFLRIHSRRLFSRVLQTGLVVSLRPLQPGCMRKWTVFFFFFIIFFFYCNEFRWHCNCAKPLLLQPTNLCRSANANLCLLRAHLNVRRLSLVPSHVSVWGIWVQETRCVVTPGTVANGDAEFMSNR